MKSELNNVPPILFHGFKNSEIVFADLPGYRDYLIWLEYDPNTSSYFQPRMDLILSRQKKKQQGNLKIDFWVNHADNTSEFVHIHNSEQIDPYILPEAIGCAAAVDTIFTPVRLQSILCEPRRSNLEILWKHTRREIKAIHLAYLNKFFKEEYYPTVGGLRKFFERGGLPPDLAYALLFRRAALADLVHFPLSEDTVILPNTEFNYSVSEDVVAQQSFLEIWKGFDPDEKFKKL